MFKKPSLAKVYNFLRKYYPIILGIIFALLLCFNAWIYYQYVYLTTQARPEPVLEKIAIDQETLEKLLDNLAKRDENLSRIKTTRYSDPFND